MLQEAGQCPQADYVVYDTHEEEEGSVDDELSGSGEFPEYVDTMEYEYTYDAKSDKASIYKTPFQFPTWLISVLNFIGNIWFLLCWVSKEQYHETKWRNMSSIYETVTCCIFVWIRMRLM